MWLVVVAPKDPAEECCTLSILETFLWKAMKPFQTYSTWQCYYAFAKKVVPHLASGINANNIGLRARLLTRHVEREECIPNSKLFSLVSGLVSQLVFQLVWDTLSVLWLVSKNSCAIGEIVWGLRWCNLIIILLFTKRLVVGCGFCMFGDLLNLQLVRIVQSRIHNSTA